MPISAVYTTQFIGTQGLVDEIGYTVPDGFVAVLRDADLYVHEGIVTESICFLKSLSGGWTIARFVNDPDGSLPAPHSYHWSGRVAFHPGEQFGFSTDGSSWDVSCCGYLLTLAP